ncbi:hypothetical protein GA0115251_13536 [Streptomyces sp. TverLS-915]|nr:hypothetical protein GA0115251_13536 [Streptomyces sp. TverLS-915]
MVRASGKPLKTLQKGGGQRGGGGLGEGGLETPLFVGVGLAAGAGGEVGEDSLTGVVIQLTVHEGGEAVTEVLLGEAAPGGWGT